MSKLTAVTIIARGRTITYFLVLPYVDGKPVVQDVHLSRLRAFEGLARGETFTIC